jgi:hypothetical protein
VQQLAELEEIIEYRRLVLQGQGGSNVASDVLNSHSDVAMGVSTARANDMMVPGGRGGAPVRSPSYKPSYTFFSVQLAQYNCLLFAWLSRSALICNVRLSVMRFLESSLLN